MTRLYRALLHLYPASFRREYGKEMTAVFAARWRDAEGIPASIGLLLSAVFEVLGNATLVHFDILRQDLAHLRRSWSRTPAFALTAVCVTALGIGANAAAFAVADFALIRPLPYPDADRLVALWQRPPGYDQMELSPANYRDWREMASSFETMGAFNNVAANLVGLDQPERVEGAWVEPTLLQVLGIPPALGRGFTAADAEPGAPGTVILSDPFWRARFAADPGVLGRVIHLDG
ncbi:MAG: ABC transporter permease, partial [Gemmatimonadales bacterium]